MTNPQNTPGNKFELLMAGILKVKDIDPGEHEAIIEAGIEYVHQYGLDQGVKDELQRDSTQALQSVMSTGVVDLSGPMRLRARLAIRALLDGDKDAATERFIKQNGNLVLEILASRAQKALNP